MGMSVGGGHGGVSSEPNVIPMIDIMLVLLIIFMISQPLSRMAIDVQVPPLETAPSDGPSSQIVLNILEDGNYEINGQPVPPGQLDTQIHAIYDNRPAKLIFIKAMASRTYQDWIKASDIVRGAGVQVIGFTPKG
ncbi:MAG: biopolymer transporter ExbD [Gemmatimonadetes bacterium]|nr:biopolymer transporter ExbD [Gemmatimonadota bacterium]